MAVNELRNSPYIFPLLYTIQKTKNTRLYICAVFELSSKEMNQDHLNKCLFHQASIHQKLSCILDYLSPLAI
jgi:hypothetical protein